MWMSIEYALFDITLGYEYASDMNDDDGKTVNERIENKKKNNKNWMKRHTYTNILFGTNVTA